MLVPSKGKVVGSLRCIFCQIDSAKVIAENEHAVSVKDEFPVTPHHCLVMPKRHVTDVFGLSQEELLACYALLNEQRRALLLEDPSIVAFNVGSNAGEAAGQSMFHCHLHLIPRRHGDVAVPKGGIRNLIRGGAPAK